MVSNIIDKVLFFVSRGRLCGRPLRFRGVRFFILFLTPKPCVMINLSNKQGVFSSGGIGRKNSSFLWLSVHNALHNEHQRILKFIAHWWWRGGWRCRWWWKAQSLFSAGRSEVPAIILTIAITIGTNLHLSGEWQTSINLLSKDLKAMLKFEASINKFEVKWTNHYAKT